MNDAEGYNERLFSRGIRARMHLARFAWLKQVASSYDCGQPQRVVELGCFDGRSIEWLPFKLSLYDGFDANWEGGLDIGRKYYSGKENIHFHQCSTPNEMALHIGRYDISISLETMEHVPSHMVADYLSILAENTSKAAFFSVPNEIGLPFFAKYAAKKLFYRDSKDEPYSFTEFWNEVIGQTDKVHRNEHKGFDFRQFIQQVENRFVIKKITGIPFYWLPASLSFTIGIVAEPK